MLHQCFLLLISFRMHFNNNINYNQVILIMLAKIITRSLARFTKITPQIIPKLKQTLEQTRLLSSLEEYIEEENAEELFELVMNSRLNVKQANNAFDRLFELCPAQSDRQINLAVNIMKQKGINLSRIGDLPGAISQFQQAISTVLLMDDHNELALSQMHKFVADLCIQINELKKAEVALEEAKTILLRLKTQDSQDEGTLNSALACVHTQICMVLFRQKRPMESLAELNQAIKCWDMAPRKALHEYELTYRMRCMLHLMFKENAQASKAARDFLAFMEDSKEFKGRKSDKPFTLTRLYFMNIVCRSEKDQDMETEVIRLLHGFKEDKGEQKCLQLMAMLGIDPTQYKL